MAKSNLYQGENTLAVHAGEAPDPTTGASAPNITMSSTYVVDEPAGFSAHDMTDDSPYLYSRWANPTVAMLETKIAAMEGTQACAAFASGMGAASAIFLGLLSAGDHVIISDICYAGVSELANDTLPRFGIEVTRVDLSDLTAFDAALRPNTKLVHCETPANPINRLTDLAALSARAHASGALVSCDSTFASPVATKPASLGVDLVMHSITKYIGGHGDAVGGCVCGSRDLIKRLTVESAIHHGGVLSPFNAWLIARGAATLPLRMRAHSQTALSVAQWLEDHPRITRVIYPGLPSHPQYDLAQAQMTLGSGMIAFQVGDRATGDAIAQSMTQNLGIIHYAVSLGHHRSLIFWMPTDDLLDGPFRLTSTQTASYRAYAGDGIFRFSVGLEDPEDLIAELDRVL